MAEALIEKFVKEKLAQAGILINGSNPWDPQVHDAHFYRAIFFQGSLGLGEAYMNGEYEVEKLDEFFFRLLDARLDREVNRSWLGIMFGLQAFFFNLQTKERALIVGKQHYDVGNDLFEAMLDKRMCYSCGYWKSAHNLDEAQEAKLDLICRKIGLKPGNKVLDIGCGWGSFAKFAAERYGAHVVGITISARQLEFAKESCRGLPVELRFQDYRDLNEKFDHIVSIGQMEHVGYKNYQIYMEIVNRCLNEDGLFLLHTIGSRASFKSGDPWLTKYIFPNGMLPSIAQLSTASENLFIMEDLHNFGADYDKTLMAWWHSFDSHWDELKGQYDERFYRMWKYYLLSMAGIFRARHAQLWQIVFSKNGVKGGYSRL